MKRALRITGAAACLFAVFLSVGGHWAVLQSIAWARMFADFSRTESLASAVEKTFDGRHPCAMCLKIREGRAQEKNPPPLLKWEKLPEFVPQVVRMFVPVPPIAGQPVVTFVPILHADFISTPPKPPPRAV
jgi:hypothetical protein